MEVFAGLLEPFPKAVFEDCRLYGFAVHKGGLQEHFAVKLGVHCHVLSEIRDHFQLIRRVLQHFRQLMYIAFRLLQAIAIFRLRCDVVEVINEHL